MGRQHGDMWVRVVPSDHPRSFLDGGRHFLGLRRRGGEQLGVDLDAVLLPLAPHLRRRPPYHGGRAAPARRLDVAEEEAHDLLGLGGEGVGEACEPHLLAYLHRGQRHLRRRRPRSPPIGWGFGAAVDRRVRGSSELEQPTFFFFFWERLRRVAGVAWAACFAAGLAPGHAVRVWWGQGSGAAEPAAGAQK